MGDTLSIILNQDGIYIQLDILKNCVTNLFLNANI